jgi:hypothetical protein
MPWARLEDSYFTHRKVADLSKDAKLLDLAAIAFSARELRDGELSRSDVRVIAAQVDVEDVFAVADQLVAAERWGKTENGYIIHDYLKYNPSREQVLKEREATAKRVAEWRAGKRANRSKPRNGVTNSERTASPDPVPVPDSGPTSEPGPVPIRPTGRARGARKHAAPPPDGQSNRASEERENAHANDDRSLFIDAQVRDYVAARGHDFADNDRARTEACVQRLWINSGLEREQFFEIVEEAFRRTKDMLMSGGLSRNEQGRQKGWPMALQLIRELIARSQTASNGHARAGPPPRRELAGSISR